MMYQVGVVLGVPVYNKVSYDEDDPVLNINLSDM